MTMIEAAFRSEGRRKRSPPKKTTYIVAVFQRGELWGYFSVEARSAKEARGRFGGDPRLTYHDTELVVLPKAHRHSNPLTHSLATDRSFPDRTGFVAVLERSEFERRCLEADSIWEAKKAELANRIGAYERPQRTPTIEDLPSMLRQRIRVTNLGCWLWTARPGTSERSRRPIHRDDYGRVRYEGRTWAAHRLIYHLLVGPIPDGASMLHACDTPACVSPHHLRPGTPQENHDDMVAKGRRLRP
jgi:hypothetical protein